MSTKMQEQLLKSRDACVGLCTKLNARRQSGLVRGCENAPHVLDGTANSDGSWSVGCLTIMGPRKSQFRAAGGTNAASADWK